MANTTTTYTKYDTQGGFGISLMELRELMELRRTEAVAKVAEMGGVKNICEMLKSSMTGGLNIVHVIVLLVHKLYMYNFTNCSVDLTANNLTLTSINIYSGLTGEESDLEERRHIFGTNVIPPKKPKTFMDLLWDALQDTTLIILCISALVSLILWLITKYGGTLLNMPHDEDEDHGWIDSLAIFVTVCAVCFVTAINDYSKEQQFRGLQSKLETDHRFPVIRKGEAIEVQNAEIVVGDICQVQQRKHRPPQDKHIYSET